MKLDTHKKTIFLFVFIYMSVVYNHMDAEHNVCMIYHVEKTNWGAAKLSWLKWIDKVHMLLALNNTLHN